MISDILSDSIANIKEYQKMPNYKKMHTEINVLINIMEYSRQWLDDVNPTGRLVNADFLRDHADYLDTHK